MPLLIARARAEEARQSGNGQELPSEPHPLEFSFASPQHRQSRRSSEPEPVQPDVEVTPHLMPRSQLSRRPPDPPLPVTEDQPRPFGSHATDQVVQAGLCEDWL
jgi:hypothetical protein